MVRQQVVLLVMRIGGIHERIYPALFFTMFYVYVLESCLNNSFYVGSTNDLKNRFKKHNEGKVFSTKRYKPWKLIYYEAYTDEKLARMREQRLKHHGNAWKQLKQRIITEMKNGAGFTFIELIIYMAIVTIMLTAIIPFAWNVIGGGVKSATQQEVFSAARAISERIKYEIRNASGINSVSPTQISLATPFTATNPTVIYLNRGFIHLTQGAGSPIYLNSNNASVSALTFTNYTSSGNTTKNIGFSLTISASYSGTVRQEFKATTTVSSSAELRSN